MKITKDHKEGFAVAVVLLLVIYFLFIRKSKSSFISERGGKNEKWKLYTWAGTDKFSGYINCTGDNQTANCCLKKCRNLEDNVPLWGQCFDNCMGAETKVNKPVLKS